MLIRSADCSMYGGLSYFLPWKKGEAVHDKTLGLRALAIQDMQT